MAEAPVRDSSAGGNPPLGLLELIAVLRIVQEVGEVGEQIQAVAKHETGRAERRGAVRALKIGGEALAVRLAAVAGIDQAEPGNKAAVDRAFGHLIG